VGTAIERLRLLRAPKWNPPSGIFDQPPTGHSQTAQTGEVANIKRSTGTREELDGFMRDLIPIVEANDIDPARYRLGCRRGLSEG